MGEREAPALLGPWREAARISRHPASQHLLSTQLQPLASLPPGTPLPLPHSQPVRRLMAGHMCTAAVGPVNTMPGCRAGGQSLVTTKEGKRGWPPRALGHP